MVVSVVLFCGSIVSKIWVSFLRVATDKLCSSYPLPSCIALVKIAHRFHGSIAVNERRSLLEVITRINSRPGILQSRSDGESTLVFNN